MVAAREPCRYVWQGNEQRPLQLTPGIGYEFKVAQSVTFCYGDLCPKTN